MASEIMACTRSSKNIMHWNDESGADGEKDKKLAGINFDLFDKFCFGICILHRYMFRRTAAY